MADYLLSQAAKDDLRRIYRYGVEHFGIQQADIYFQKLFDRFEQIALEPSFYPKVDYIRKGYRRCVCGSDSIYYRVNNGRAEILSIMGRQEFDGCL